jgi:WD40 repeat protein
MPAHPLALRSAVSGLPVLASALACAFLTAPGRAQETTRVSVDSAGSQADKNSYLASISGDGRYVAFTSHATNLVTGDTNGVEDVFVHDRQTGATTRVSVDSAGGQGNAYCFWNAISADGRFVAFDSFASNLVSDDTNVDYDVFVHDRQTGTTTRVSVDSAGAQGNGEFPSISADGRLVAFHSTASLVPGDTNLENDVFVHDRQTGTTLRVSVDSAGGEGNGYSARPSISADGRFVAFDSLASNLVPGDTNGDDDVFVHDRQTGTTTRVSVDSAGAQGNKGSVSASVSGDGRFVAFDSFASNLVPGDINEQWDAFVHDRQTGSTTRASVDSDGLPRRRGSLNAEISADGRFVAFQSAARLVSDDTNEWLDVFVHDLKTGATTRVSVDSSGGEGNDHSEFPSLSADGRFVAFDSLADNLVSGDTNARWDIFVHERCTTDATWTNYGTGFPGSNGVPSLTSLADPVLGTVLTLELGNSYGLSTCGLFFVGFQQTVLHSVWGGDLLVVPMLTLAIDMPPDGTSISGHLPIDSNLCGFTIYLQAIEIDPGAAMGVSFTQGLELLLGS